MRARKITKGYNNYLQWELQIDEIQIIKNYLENAELDKEEYDELLCSKTITELIERLKTIELPTEQQTTLMQKLRALYCHYRNLYDL